MGRINIRAKGQNGEREFAKWLQKNFNLEHLPQRCLEQVRYGSHSKNHQGYDLIGFEPFAIEVKRQETLALRTWWRQAKISAQKSNQNMIPVVAYRRNRRQWKFLIGATHLGLKVGYIHLEAPEFIAWCNTILDKESEDASLQKAG